MKKKNITSLFLFLLLILFLAVCGKMETVEKVIEVEQTVMEDTADRLVWDKNNIYLDLVITPNNEKYILDEDELEDALNEKILGKAEFDLAYETLHRLEKKYDSQENVNELALVMNKYLENMNDKIKSAEIIVKEDIL